MADPLKLYRLLLKLYPARFREEYETPLGQQFADEYREAEGTLGRIAVWIRTIRDLAVSIPLEFTRELRQDLAYSVRIYSRRPGVTLLAIAAMALAIGATTGVFSVVNALLLRSLPFRSPERIVQFGFAFTGPQAAPAFHTWRTHSAYLEDVSKYSQNEVNLSGSAQSVRVKLAETTSNFFNVLGREPEIGRGFVAGEDTPGKGTSALISYGLWQQFFGGDPRALGQTIHLNGTPFTLTGIMPPGFDYPAKTAVWTSTVFDPADRIPKSGPIWAVTFGRLKPGVSLARAQSMFDAERKHVALKFEQDNPVKLTPLRDQLVGPVRKASLVLLGAVSFVLSIACANVANLLLTRITERRKELVLRAALGASRARLVQQLITESVLLTALAALAGMLVAQWAVKLSTAAQPAQLAALDYTILDWRVVGFAIGLAALTGLLFGVLPASLIARIQPGEEIVRTAANSSSTGIRRLRGILVTVQAALTLMLLGGSIVMGRGFLKMLGADLGFHTDHVATMSVSLGGTRYNNGSLRTQYFRDALERIRKVPGVESAAAIDSLPLATDAFMGNEVKLESRNIGFASMIWTTPDYFRTLDSPTLYGRDFLPSDFNSAEHSVVVNEEFARQAKLGRELIGKKFKGFVVGDAEVTIIGVTRTVHYSTNPDEHPMAQVFLLPGKFTPMAMTFVARVHGKTEAYLPIIRDAIQSIDRQVPVFNLKTLDQRLADDLARPRFYTTAVLFFAGFALLLAMIGIYGVASYSIVQRTHELGVRIAIGASAERMRWMLLRQSLLPVALGMAAGVAGAIGLSQFLKHLMEGAQRVDMPTCAVAAAALALAAAAAVWSATRRILRLDPMQVLRAE